jgi:hypothetical protein
MLAGGVALAARYGDFSMRASDRMEMGADTLKPTTLLKEAISVTKDLICGMTVDEATALRRT